MKLGEREARLLVDSLETLIREIIDDKVTYPTEGTYLNVYEAKEDLVNKLTGRV